ncbi:hypothetical protein BaRGS_00005692 [Batillaria attramentaria]|uniref:ADP-ribosylation factor-like protein 13B n=1 Tax=Batillaria attramentaria TaxID=370345 RepID=A0ABD0LU77_9CAEN
MFGLMGNCISAIRRRREPKKPLTLALLGVDNSGKTTASFSFSGEPIDPDVAPTLGFRSAKFVFGRYDITLYDVGGGKSMRPVWKNYFPEVYGVIYMVDSSTPDRMEEARETLRESLEHPHVTGKPVLLLANKQDKPEALDEVDLCEQLNLEVIVNTNKCPCRIETCSALRGTGRKMDPHMREGLKWLVGTVEKNEQELRARVEADMKGVEEMRKAEALARKERVRKAKEERERKEEEERKRLGIEKKDSDDEDIMNGDPFKPLNLEEIQKKEATLKEEKKRRKELEAQLKLQEAQDHKLSPRSQHNGTSLSLSNNSGEESSVLFAPRVRGSALPPLEPLGTPFLEDSGHAKKKKKKKLRGSEQHQKPEQQLAQSDTKKDEDDDDDVVIPTPRSTPAFPSDSFTEKSVRTVSNIEVSTHDDFPSRQLLAAGISRVPQPLGGGDGGDADTPRTRKKKKKRMLRSRAHPGDAVSPVDTPRPHPQMHSLDGGDSEDQDSVTSDQKRKMKLPKSRLATTAEEKYELSPRGVEGTGTNFDRKNEQRNSKLSRNMQMHSNTSFGSDQFGSKTWGLAEELPAVADDAIAFRQPNFTDDDDVIL